MGSISVKIMGVSLNNITVDDDKELLISSAADFINDKYEEIKRDKIDDIVDSNVLRSLTILDIATELQTIKGEQEGISDRNHKKVDELIKMIDGLHLSD